MPTFGIYFVSKTPRIIIGLNENFPYALQVGLEEMLVKESVPVPWMEVAESLGHSEEGSSPTYPLEQPYP